MESLKLDPHLKKFNLTANQRLSLAYGADILDNRIEVAIFMSLYKDTSKHNVWKLAKSAGVSRSTFSRRLRNMLKHNWLTNSRGRYYLTPSQRKFVDHYIYATFVLGEATKELHARLKV